MITREPAVAGTFYPSSSKDLIEEIAGYFHNAKCKALSGDLQAIIVPHAGYIFSGEAAAFGYIQVPPDKNYENIFIIGSSHYTYFDGASIYNLGNYKTPMGEVIINLDLANNLITNNKEFFYYSEAHEKEHSLEVQLPFLQYRMDAMPFIVPIVIGTQQLPTIGKIAEALKPYFNENNLFIISTDFSHFPSYEDAVKIDANTADAISRNNPKEFLQAIRKNKELYPMNLQTSICGWTSVLTLLNITKDLLNTSFHHLFYNNSGDRPFGNKSRVVGYNTMAITVENSQVINELYFSEKSKQQLLEISKDAIASFANSGRIPKLYNFLMSEELKTAAGVFVSIYKSDELRGCIGRITSNEPLYKMVQELTISSAFFDNRFPPITYDEIPQINIEISVISPLQKVSNINEIQLGKHGIYIKKNEHTGTFLPQVAQQTGWDVHQLLGKCSRDKANLGWNGWKQAELFVYETIAISDKNANAY